MSRTLGLFGLTLVILMTAASAWGAADHWYIGWRADNGYGQGYGLDTNVGVYPQSTDGVDLGVSATADDNEREMWIDLSQSTRWVVSMISGDTRIWGADFRSPASPAGYPGQAKVWDFRVAALPDASAGPIRLCALTRITPVLPPSVVGGRAVGYRLVMVDNKGMPGAPQNGKTWQLPIPTAYQSGTPYWTLPQSDWLPMIKLSTVSDTAMIAEGYQLRFEQYVVPEPASLSALGMGVFGLAALAARRRTR